VTTIQTSPTVNLVSAADLRSVAEISKSLTDDYFSLCLMAAVVRGNDAGIPHDVGAGVEAVISRAKKGIAEGNHTGVSDRLSVISQLFEGKRPFPDDVARGIVAIIDDCLLNIGDMQQAVKGFGN